MSISSKLCSSGFSLNSSIYFSTAFILSLSTQLSDIFLRPSISDCLTSFISLANSCCDRAFTVLLPLFFLWVLSFASSPSDSYAGWLFLWLAYIIFKCFSNMAILLIWAHPFCIIPNSSFRYSRSCSIYYMESPHFLVTFFCCLFSWHFTIIWWLKFFADSLKNVFFLLESGCFYDIFS